MGQAGIEAIKELQQADWEDLLPRLLFYAKLRIKKLSLRDPDAFSGAEGESPQDIVMQSIEEVLSGKHARLPGSGWFDYLRTIIDSNVLEAYERSRTQEKVQE